MRQRATAKPKPCLVVVPSDPISAYVDKGREDLLQDYYNPQGIFGEVYALSPLEKGIRRAYGMTVIGVKEDDFVAALRDLRPDVVRAYGGYWPADYVCRNKVPGIPVVVSVHDGNPINLHASVKGADMVICMSEPVRGMALAKGVQSGRIRMLPNRIDLNIFHPITDSVALGSIEAHLPKGRRILHVGRKSPEKNLDTVIRSLRFLPEYYSVIAVGQGDQGPYREIARQEGVEERCCWIESVRNAELPALMSRCDCLCNPSLYEGFGIVFIEAAACGTPIVTSDIAPMNSYLQNDVSACLVADYRNPEAVAKSILKTCEDDKYRRALSRESVKVASSYSKDYIDSLEVAYYREAIRLGVQPSRKLGIQVASKVHATALLAGKVKTGVRRLARTIRRQRSLQPEDVTLKTLSGQTLVVIPSEPIEAYERAGYGGWLKDYYNPQGRFSNVHVLSPLEPCDRSAHGMTIHGGNEKTFRLALRAIKPDVIRAYGGFWPSNWALRYRQPNVPIVVSVHDRRPEMIHHSVRYADRVICVSNAVREAVRRLGVPESRLRLLPNRVDRRLFRRIEDENALAALRSRFPPGYHILHVGRKSHEKNLDTVIRALPLLPQDYSCVFVGAGDDTEYRALASDLGVADRCFWLDRVENHELPVWLSWCDCMCVPSRDEGFGIVFIEAAACGAAIVTSNIAPMNEYLKDGGSARLVDEYDDPDAIASAIRRVCTDPEYRSTITGGALAISKTFDSAVIDAKEVEIYREVMRSLEASCVLQIRRKCWELKEQTFLRLARLKGRVDGINFRGHGSRLWHWCRATRRAVLRWKQEGAWGGFSLSKGCLPQRAARTAPSVVLQWLRGQELETGGIRAHSRHKNAYPEVSGYLIPTLIQYGERPFASRIARWLLCVQNRDGSFGDPDCGEPHVFDSGQVLRGLLAISGSMPLAKDAARRVADYLCASMEDSGRGGFGKRYQGDVPEGVHLYVLPALCEAAAELGNPEYAERADQCRKYYLTLPDSLQEDTLTHFLAYQLDALIDLGYPELARPVLDQLRERQGRDGSVIGMGGVEWICTPGLAQIAICWYKIGYWEAADRALDWLGAHVGSSGGWPGSLGPGATYFQDVEIPWAAKYYLDANAWRVRCFMDRHAPVFPSEISADDGRLKAIGEVIRPNDRVIEVGCGKGRFLKALRDREPSLSCTGVDISKAMLRLLPEGIESFTGTLESVPVRDGLFDVAFSVEAIEHSANPGAAIDEMVRIAKPGGWVMIIDKEAGAWGRLACPAWEAWPANLFVKEQLARGCDLVTAAPVGYDGKAPDGLMMAWRGRKRGQLNPGEWEQAITPESSFEGLPERIRLGRISPWATEMLLLTSVGDKVLEIGSGTAEISLRLALSGREVTALDYNADLLEKTRQCAGQLQVAIQTVCADCTSPLPYADKEFDCVWSSGLLEHFSGPERCAMLKEFGRVSSGRVVSIVPNAACLAYTLGKDRLERRGEWRYGFEKALVSLRDDYAAAGLVVESEHSVGAKHALDFLPPDDPVKKALEYAFKELSDDELCLRQQGYLLITVGGRQRST